MKRQNKLAKPKSSVHTRAKDGRKIRLMETAFAKRRAYAGGPRLVC